MAYAYTGVYACNKASTWVAEDEYEVQMDAVAKVHIKQTLVDCFINTVYLYDCFIYLRHHPPSNVHEDVYIYIGWCQKSAFESIKEGFLCMICTIVRQ